MKYPDIETIINTPVDIPCIRLADIAEPLRERFETFLLGRAVPSIDGAGPCAYMTDWWQFVNSVEVEYDGAAVLGVT